MTTCSCFSLPRLEVMDCAASAVDFDVASSFAVFGAGRVFGTPRGSEVASGPSAPSGPSTAEASGRLGPPPRS